MAGAHGSLHGQHWEQDTEALTFTRLRQKGKQNGACSSDALPKLLPFAPGIIAASLHGVMTARLG